MEDTASPPASTTFASLRKQRIKLKEPLDWQGVEVIEQGGKATLFVHAKPFPSLFTQSSDGITTVFTLSASAEGRETVFTGRADLPGVGTIACGRTREGGLRESPVC